MLINKKVNHTLYVRFYQTVWMKSYSCCKEKVEFSFHQYIKKIYLSSSTKYDD
jgi:hypothetical protein